MYYSSKYALEKSLKHGSICKSCSKTGILSPNFGRKQSKKEKEKRAKKLRGLKRTPESIQKYSKSKIGIKNPKYNDHTPKSIEHSRKIRLGCIKTLNEKLSLVGKSISPTINPKACKVIDEYGKQNGYNFQHGLNGGEFCIKELGYWVDGYDRDKNVVIEYYERRHNRTKDKIRDEKRRLEIIDFLKCKFIIVRE